MNILTTQYVPQLQRLEIYLAGCKGVDGVHCSGCHNPESWDFSAGKEINYAKLIDIANSSLIKNVWILGGEPLDQPIDELDLLLSLMSTTKKPLWLFTRFEFEEIPSYFKRSLTHIKAGAYINSLPTKQLNSINLTLGSSNQKLFKKDTDIWQEVL